MQSQSSQMQIFHFNNFVAIRQHLRVRRREENSFQERKTTFFLIDGQSLIHKRHNKFIRMNPGTTGCRQGEGRADVQNSRLSFASILLLYQSQNSASVVNIEYESLRETNAIKNFAKSVSLSQEGVEGTRIPKFNAQEFHSVISTTLQYNVEGKKILSSWSFIMKRETIVIIDWKIIANNYIEKSMEDIIIDNICAF